VLDLASRADVVVENFTTGTAERLGFGYGALQALNPGIVYCSISGYGQTGPERERAGYDFVMQAESGLMAITGMPDGQPQRFGVAAVDIVAGMVAAQSILAALYQRRDTGVGQYIDVALLDCALNLLVNVGTGYLNAGVEPVRFGNAHPTVVPYQVFDCADGVVALAVGNDRMFASLCSSVVHRPDLAADPRFLTSAGRAIHRAPLTEDLALEFRKRTREEWLDACHAAGVAAGSVKSVSEALAAPSVVGRGVIQQLEHPDLGEVRLIRPAHGLESQADTSPKPPPLLGEDTRSVLANVLGYAPHHIAELEQLGIVRANRTGMKEPAT
jgi:crotonobetainyl-CoA:carnitine CoA-transferase CaiB-like acyl-CoA transferase